MDKRKFLVINTSFPEVDQLAVALCEAGLLSRYIRPYANKSRAWERTLASSPGLGKIYKRTFGRRALPEGLDGKLVQETGVFFDYAGSSIVRLPKSMGSSIGVSILNARNRRVARSGKRHLSDVIGVIAGWGCAGAAFKEMKSRDGLCILNYSYAHHRFARKLLLEEAEREPGFASSLYNQILPEWLESQLDTEITLADQILVGSTFVRDSFVNEGVAKEKLKIIPYGADATLFRPVSIARQPTEKFNVLYVGQITQRKGLSYLLRAYERIHGPGTSLTLVGSIQGNGSCLVPYRHLFTHIPHTPRQALYEIYQRADVFLFPTLVEGMPLVLLEAMASGLPVITTANGPGDIVRDAIDGFLVPPRDVDAIVERLERLRADPMLRLSMGKSARLRAKEFSWERYREVVRRYFKSCLHEREPGQNLLNSRSKV